MFPVQTSCAAALIDGIHTDVAVLGFSNYVVVLVTQLQSIGSLMESVVSAAATHSDPDALSRSVQDIPVDVKFILGSQNASAPVSSLYQILAIHLSQLKHAQNPADQRPLLLGVGLSLPRELVAPSGLDDHAELPDLSAHMPIINAVGDTVSRCRPW
ncbi:hypothetical protein GGI15_000819 [Coemansia interrupta]|uniref:Proteasome assembly chaperone 3 n=1 Tax=Coemansia interrupta TaxID=1126814 RepID=A0A9W8HJC0_9FUNG|nr:hypothetical protein GGI15_000819 [Coemansia interrupta]